MGAKILIVDDEADVGTGLATGLMLEGHHPKSVRDPQEALMLVEQEPFDLIIVDYMMPTMSGIALLNRVREFVPTIKSILISGKLEPHVSEDDILADIKGTVDADAYVHKPVTSGHLMAVVNQLLGAAETASWEEIAAQHLDANKSRSKEKNAERALNKRRAGKKKK